MMNCVRTVPLRLLQNHQRSSSTTCSLRLRRCEAGVIRQRHDRRQLQLFSSHADYHSSSPLEVDRGLWERQLERLRFHLDHQDGSVDSESSLVDDDSSSVEYTTTIPDDETAELDQWMQEQRLIYSDLTAEQQEKLQEIGFSPNRRDEFWWKRYQQLVHYVQDHDGSFPENQRYEDLSREHQILYWWCKNQKKAHTIYQNGQPSTMTALRIAKLNEIDFCWNADEAIWMARYEALISYKEQHGDCLVPREYSDSALARWTGDQRFQYKLRLERQRNSLTDERLQLLQDIGFTFDAFEAKWSIRLNELRAYKAKHGHCHVPRDDESSEHRCLSNWVGQQRQLYKHGEIDEERKRLLDELGFIWDAQAHKWFQRYERLKEYARSFGNCAVPTTYPADADLSNWVKLQRAFYRNKNLSEERIQLLDDIDFLWNGRDAKWLEQFEELAEYVKLNGPAAVPTSKHSPSLRRWLDNQLAQYHRRVAGEKSTMSDFRLRRLQTLGFLLEDHNSE